LIMAMEYNAAAPVFSSKSQMENSDYACSCRFDKSMLYGVECKSSVQNDFYIRAQTGNLPLTTTDFGLMQVATAPSASFPTNSVIGELWMSYDVVFRRPKASPARFGYAVFGTNQNITVNSSTFVNYTPLTPSVPPVYPQIVYGALDKCYYTTSGTNLILTFPDALVGDVYLINMLQQSLNGAGYPVGGSVAYSTATATHATLSTSLVPNGTGGRIWWQGSTFDVFSMTWVFYCTITSVVTAPTITIAGPGALATSISGSETVTVSTILTISDIFNGIAPF
jgi:hypothetical protein